MPLEFETSKILASYTQRTRVDGKEYEMTLDYNQRRECYTLSLVHINSGEVIIRSQMLRCLNPLLRKRRYLEQCPRGNLMVWPNSNDTTPPKYGQLATDERCTLMYWTEEESEAGLVRDKLLNQVPTQ